MWMAVARVLIMGMGMESKAESEVWRKLEVWWNLLWMLELAAFSRINLIYNRNSKMLVRLTKKLTINCNNK